MCTSLFPEFFWRFVMEADTLSMVVCTVGTCLLFASRFVLDPYNLMITVGMVGTITGGAGLAVCGWEMLWLSKRAS